MSKNAGFGCPPDAGARGHPHNIRRRLRSGLWSLSSMTRLAAQVDCPLSIGGAIQVMRNSLGALSPPP